MDRVDMDWENLGFALVKTDVNMRAVFKDGLWGPLERFESDEIKLHMAATCLHYGQACFEGLKAFETKDGRVVVFRMEQNARRMVRSAEKIKMEPVPEDLFIQAVVQAVQANRRFVPPFGTGAALYIRPFLFGSEPRVGVKPAEEYMFVVFVTPVGPYFKSGFKPVDLVIEDEFDRAAPNGVGDVKVAGNYAAGMRASMRARENNFTEVLYLDARYKRYIDESGPANFFAISKDGRYVTPQSPSILPSITNDSLITIAQDLGMQVERRPVAVEELEHFVEAGCCGTAAVITPVGSITWGEKRIVYAPDGQPGKVCSELYKTLCGIHTGTVEDKHGWLTEIK